MHRQLHYKHWEVHIDFLCELGFGVWEELSWWLSWGWGNFLQSE